jgi:DAK2 domain fusion protein YloV
MSKIGASAIVTAEIDTAHPEQAQVGNGLDFKALILSSAKWLEKHFEAINALNVFPVPDGDTGTNMSRTMEAAVAEIANIIEPSVEVMSKKLSYGALMGARGNSGVILSQIIRGLADGFNGKERFTAADMAHALSKAKEMAYKAVMKPVEGTILTVVRESAEAAELAAKESDSFSHVLGAAVEAAKHSVERTPQLLAALRDAGVVDAGGHGYFIILEGALKYLRGESLDVVELSEVEKAKPKFDLQAESEHRMDEYGYCTNFMLYAEPPLNFEQVRDILSEMGNSAVIVGDSSMVKVHIHTEDPGKVLSYATSLGALSQIKLDNMQFQHEEAFGAKATRPSTSPTLASETLDGDDDLGSAPLLPQAKVSLVVVAPGAGLAEVFRAFGADQIVAGGQTMNPSTQELLQAVENAPNEQVLILPNNKNIIMVAQQLQNVSQKKVEVVPSTTIPQGIMALQAFNYEGDLEENRQAMSEMLSAVATGEVTRAVRTATVNGIQVETGQWIGLLNDELSVATASKEETIWQLLEQMEATNRDLLTFYYGENITEAEAETMQAQVQKRYPNQSVEIVNGGQPHYDYIISAE